MALSPPPPADGGPPPARPFSEPKRIYNIVDPAALAHIYAAALTAHVHGTSGADRERSAVARVVAGAAVRDFVSLMREVVPHAG